MSGKIELKYNSYKLHFDFINNANGKLINFEDIEAKNKNEFYLKFDKIVTVIGDKSLLFIANVLGTDIPSRTVSVVQEMDEICKKSYKRIK